MAINNETKSFGLPWKRQYGYSQTVKVGDTIYLSGQVSNNCYPLNMSINYNKQLIIPYCKPLYSCLLLSDELAYIFGNNIHFQ
jgi:hypothetical protein